MALNGALSAAGKRPQAGVMLAFAGGQRPDQSAIVRAMEASRHGTISLIPGAAGETQSDWLELIAQGLTYDCLGLAPGPALTQPEWRYRLGLAGNGATAASGAAGEAIGLFAGPHIEAAAHTLPVLRAQLMLARDIISALPAVSAVGWTPAGVLIAPAPFVAAVDGWLAGQAFPALALVGFRADADGTVTSDGLSFFTGQELRIDGGVAAGPLPAVQLGARLVHHLVAADPLAAAQEFMGPAGEALRLLPEDGRRVVRVVRV